MIGLIDIAKKGTTENRIVFMKRGRVLTVRSVVASNAAATER